MLVDLVIPFNSTIHVTVGTVYYRREITEYSGQCVGSQQQNQRCTVISIDDFQYSKILIMLVMLLHIMVCMDVWSKITLRTRVV